MGIKDLIVFKFIIYLLIKLFAADDALLGKLLGNIKAFLKNFSIRRIKLGQIIEFLELLDMQESKSAMADLFKSILVSINEINNIHYYNQFKLNPYKWKCDKYRP